jgi:hypothetical protein
MLLLHHVTRCVALSLRATRRPALAAARVRART